MFFQEFLHICKILFPYRFANFSDIFHHFRIIFAICSHLISLISILGFQRYSPCVLTQHIDNGENIYDTVRRNSRKTCQCLHAYMFQIGTILFEQDQQICIIAYMFHINLFYLLNIVIYLTAMLYEIEVNTFSVQFQC